MFYGNAHLENYFALCGFPKLWLNKLGDICYKFELKNFKNEVITKILEEHSSKTLLKLSVLTFFHNGSKKYQKTSTTITV